MDLLSQRLIYAGKTVQKEKKGCVVNIMFSYNPQKRNYITGEMHLTPCSILWSPAWSMEHGAWSMATYPLAEKISRIVALVSIIGEKTVRKEDFFVTRP